MSFASRAEFAAHLSEHQRLIIWNCTECGHAEEKRDFIQDHIDLNHTKDGWGDQDVIITQKLVLRDLSHQLCPFCGKVPGALEFVGHLCHHLEEISLSAIPPDSGADEEDEGGSSLGASRGRANESPSLKFFKSSYERHEALSLEMSRMSFPGTFSAQRDLQQTSSYWTVPEQDDIPTLLAQFGTDWGAIANYMGSKTDVMVKNYYSRQVESGRQPELEAIAKEADEKRARAEETTPAPVFPPMPESRFGTLGADIPQLPPLCAIPPMTEVKHDTSSLPKNTRRNIRTQELEEYKDLITRLHVDEGQTWRSVQDVLAKQHDVHVT